MTILKIEKIKNPSTVTFVMLFLFFGLGVGASFGFAMADINPFRSVFAYLSIAMILYFFVQIKSVINTYAIYKKTNLKMNDIFGSTFFYWIFTLTLLVPFIYINIPAFQLIDYPYNIDEFEKNIAIIVEFSIRYAPNAEVIELLLKYGNFAIIVPCTLVSSLLLSISSWLYIRRMRSYHFVELEEYNFQRDKKIEKRKENQEHKSYKWDQNNDDY